VEVLDYKYSLTLNIFFIQNSECETVQESVKESQDFHKILVTCPRSALWLFSG